MTPPWLREIFKFYDMSVKSAATFGILVTLSRHFMPHVGRVNKSCHHSHASMRSGGLLTR